MTKKEVGKYVFTIDSLMNANSLQKFSYPNMSSCGGGLYGYYDHDKLVYIDATYQAELGYSRREMYFKDSVIYKIIYREYFADWDKYQKINSIDTVDTSKITYSDTLYTIIFAKTIYFTKASKSKLISKKANKNLIFSLLDCGREMKLELESEKTNP